MQAPSGRKMVNVLLVEDDDVDARAIRRAFVKAEIKNPIVRVKDGVSALEALRGHGGTAPLGAPYLLLVDLNLPRMDGIELLHEIRDDANLRTAVAYVLTTSNLEEDKTAAHRLNVAGYILKSNAGVDFLQLTDLLESYWRIAELPGE